jgi:uncharacterized protein
MQIDSHVHFTPPSLAANIERFSEDEPLWGLLLNPGKADAPAQGWASAERMIADMDAAQIDRVILQGEYRLRHESCVERNNQGLEILKQYPDRVTGFAVVQPTAGDRALDELQRCLDGGMRGVGEMNPYGANLRLDHPDFLKVVEFCIDHDLPLNLHVNEEVGHYYPGKSATPLSHYYQLVLRYPELKLILAHWGGGLMFYELMPSVRAALKNVWYDTAASPLLFPTNKIFQTALGCVDHRKILFGSDYPLLIYPRRQLEPGFGMFLAEIDALGLDDDVYADIMGLNAARLLGFAEAGQAEQSARSTIPRPGGAAPESAEVEEITRFLPVRQVAETWPETQAVFEQHGIPWQDQPVPFWEPIAQAAAVKGYGPADTRRLLDELNEIIHNGS